MLFREDHVEGFCEWGEKLSDVLKTEQHLTLAELLTNFKERICLAEYVVGE
jgi:hypothetical protein